MTGVASPGGINDWRAIGESDSDLFSFVKNCGGDELWTNESWLVDGLGSQLRRFRKSHHLIRDRLALIRGDRDSDVEGARRADRVRIKDNKKARGRDGMSLLEGTIDSRNHPLAVVEDIAASNNWPFERSGEDELTIVSKGQWTDYQISFTWMGEIEALHLACAFDMKIPPARRGEVQKLVALVNEQLWVGHFDLWTHTGMIMHRQALVLPNGMSASTAQCEAMLSNAILACERYYPALNFVVWAGKTPQEAMAAAMFDVEGEA
jgi:hypothetical protein